MLKAQLLAAAALAMMAGSDAPAQRRDSKYPGYSLRTRATKSSMASKASKNRSRQKMADASRRANRKKK